MDKRSKQKCVYCGSPDDLTRDHVPPQCLFGRGNRDHLVTVPACRRCNSKASRDDEYFRNYLCLRDDLKNDPRIVAIDAANRRAFDRSPGLLRSLARSWRQANIRSPAGVYMGKKWVGNIDRAPLLRVVERTVRGLHFKELGMAVAADYGVVCGTLENLASQRPDQQRTMMDLLEIVRAHGKVDSRGKGVVLWAHQKADDDPLSSFWVLAFFDQVVYGATVSPRHN